MRRQALQSLFFTDNSGLQVIVLSYDSVSLSKDKGEGNRPVLPKGEAWIKEGTEANHPV